MSDLSLFLKSNKKAKENVTYAATKSLTDKDGNPLLWAIKSLTTKESEDIRESCTKESLPYLSDKYMNLLLYF